ncbi:MAG: 30S ribosomal protein S12 methylthiotransferase RimO [Bacteriovoracales bacterium]|nr:30S ribosomal protein S12 methylthiotransferase RimO [Bacteriovoracales bacterium]
MKTRPNLQKDVYFASLGCSKNLVDSEVMLGKLDREGYRVGPSPQKAKIIVVNTCSFIEAAKEESIDTILELAEYKKKGQCRALVVSGCMAQRYSTELEEALPEVDLFIGTGEYHKIAILLKALEEGSLKRKSFVDIPKFIHTDLDPRIKTSPPHIAWLKVSEGCNRNCTFCIIPTLRGKLRSRKTASLVAEAHRLCELGAKELNIISQDLSDFGSDSTEDLGDLLLGLESVEKAHWIRLFYYYPEDMSERVMKIMARSKKICPYLDMPIQHFSTKILKRMNRKATTQMIDEKIKNLKKWIPHIILRTSVIVGFPGETEEDFEELLSGIRRHRFHHLGVFQYSDEEGTPAFRLKDKVPRDIIEERYRRVYEVQKSIANDLGRELIGQTLPVIIEGNHEETDLLLCGRHRGQAPDIDGKVIINDGKIIPRGNIVQVQITDALGYDLLGRIISPSKGLS